MPHHSRLRVFTQQERIVYEEAFERQQGEEEEGEKEEESGGGIRAEHWRGMKIELYIRVCWKS